MQVNHEEDSVMYGAFCTDSSVVTYDQKRLDATKVCYLLVLMNTSILFIHALGAGLITGGILLS